VLRYSQWNSRPS